MNRFTYIGSAYIFLIKNNQVLLLRRANTGFEDGNYGVPAGHMDGGETASMACVREIKEEIGIDLKVEDLKVAHIMHRKAEKDERIDFFFTTDKWNGEVTNCEPDKCDDLSWFSLDNLPSNTIEYVRLALENYKKGIAYSEYGW